jgi:hypothetical protein
VRLYEPRIDVDTVAAIDVRTHIEAPMADFALDDELLGPGAPRAGCARCRGVQLLVAATVELQDNPKPACFAELVLRFYG